MKFNVGKFLSKISTIHGLNYIGDRRNSKFSKLFWISAFILSFLGCSFYFVQVYEKVFIKPDISVKTSFRSFTEFAFPAVTICPQNKFPHTKINYKENLKKFQNQNHSTYEERLEMELAFQACQFGEFDSENITLNISDINIVEHLSNHQYTNNEVIVRYCWDDCNDNPDIIFTRIFTFDGFCSTFNLLDFDEMFTDQIHDDFKVFKNGRKSNWKLSSGYSNTNQENYPHKIPNDYFSKIVIYFLQDHDPVDTACSQLKRGYQVYWHMPNEILSTWFPSINIYNHNGRTDAYIRIKSFKASPDLKGYKIEHRKCYFEGEKNLKFFKIYTEKNCKFECLANFTLKTCGCVRYFHPREKSTIVCSSDLLECASFAQIKLVESGSFNKCQCFPSCNNIEYELAYREDSIMFQEYLDDSFDDHEVLRDKEIALKDNGPNTKNVKHEKFKFSALHLIILKENIEERESFASYQIQHFISDFGGLLSLAMGCSILSIIELIYNFIVMGHEENEKDEEENNAKNMEI